MPASIRPKDLAAGTPNGDVALIFDNGSQVLKATPLDLMNAARPLASQSDAESGSDNQKVMSALRVQQAITAQIASAFALMAASLPDEANGDAIPAPGTGLPYKSAGVLKFA